MKQMKRLFWLWPVLLMMLAVGCLKENDEGTIVLMGTESDVKPVDLVIPDTLMGFLGDTVAMHQRQITLPAGNIPPDIEGEYVLAPMSLFAYNHRNPLPDDSLFFRFTEQHNRLVKCDIYEKSKTRESVSNAYVMGNGKHFTAYFTVTYECHPIAGENLSYELERGYLITGTVTNNGIDAAIVACLNIRVDVDPSLTSTWVSDVQSTEGDIYVYCAMGGAPFGSAKRFEWF